MAEWQLVKLGELLTESKVVSDKPSPERRIRVLLNAQGVVKRPVKEDTKGATKYYERSPNQFIYGKQNFHKGAFGVIPVDLDGFESTSDLPAFDVDEKCSPHWIDYFMKQGDFYLSLVNIARGAATKRVQPKEFLELKMPLPPLDEQQRIISRFQSIETEDQDLKHELTHQQSLLKKLRQQILQEAIEGKLTAEWRKQNPDVEPASELLKRIQEEKEQLIADKKIRKQKPLPEITPEEIPFDIPEGWEWCRLGSAGVCSTGGTPKTGVSHYYGGDIDFIGPGQITSRGELLKSDKQLSEEGIKESTEALPGDILMVCIGGSIGKSLLVEKRIGFNQQINAIRPLFCEPGYIRHSISTNVFNDLMIENATGTATPIINRSKWEALPIPLPPLAEQEAIVAKVEQLLALCDQLEARITSNQTHADQLMQSVLKEAFAASA